MTVVLRGNPWRVWGGGPGGAAGGGPPMGGGGGGGGGGGQKGGAPPLAARGAGGVERIYVSEYGGNDRVSVFDKEHKFLVSFGRPGSGDQADPVEFNRPQSIGVDQKRGRLVITDAVNHRVGVFTLDGKLVRW